MKALGIILAGGNNERMEALSYRRAIAAMPIAGSYRSIDFALSNMTNANINTVAVITQYSTRSLNEHLSSPAWWGFGRKQGGLFMLNPTITKENSEWYRGTADALIQNLDFLYDRHEPYVVIAPGDGIVKLDLNAVLEQHAATGAEITVICKKMTHIDSTRFGVVELDGEKRISSWSEKQENARGCYVNCGIYVVRRRRLIQLLEDLRRENKFDFVRDCVARDLDRRRIVAFLHEGYWTNINTVESYFDCNMDLLDPELRRYFFYDYPTVMTKVDDYPPAKFNGSACVKNSVIAGGGIVNGEVKDSVLFKKVYIGDGASVKGSVLLDDVYVGNSVRLEYCIVEKHVKLEDGAEYRGTPEKPLVITG